MCIRKGIVKKKGSHGRGSADSSLCTHALLYGQGRRISCCMCLLGLFTDAHTFHAFNRICCTIRFEMFDSSSSHVSKHFRLLQLDINSDNKLFMICYFSSWKQWKNRKFSVSDQQLPQWNICWKKICRECFCIALTHGNADADRDSPISIKHMLTEEKSRMSNNSLNARSSITDRMQQYDHLAHRVPITPKKLASGARMPVLQITYWRAKEIGGRKKKKSRA